MKKSTKRFWLVAGFLAAFGVVAGSMAMGHGKTAAEQEFEIPPPTPEQQRAIDEMHERDKYRSMPKCEGEIINLDMGPIKLKVPRDISYISLPGKVQIDPQRPSPDYSCDQTSFENVIGFRWGNIQVQLDKEHYIQEYGLTSYAGRMQHFEKEGITPNKEIRKDSITHLFVNNWAVEFFILPQEIAPTANGEPVLYTCKVRPPNYKGAAGMFCETSYYHPSGLHIRYDFPRYDDTTDHLLEKDQWYRKLLENTIVENSYQFEKRKTP